MATQTWLSVVSTLVNEELEFKLHTIILKYYFCSFDDMQKPISTIIKPTRKKRKVKYHTKFPSKKYKQILHFDYSLVQMPFRVSFCTAVIMCTYHQSRTVLCMLDRKQSFLSQICHGNISKSINIDLCHYFIEFLIFHLVDILLFSQALSQLLNFQVMEIILWSYLFSFILKSFLGADVNLQKINRALQQLVPIVMMIEQKGTSIIGSNRNRVSDGFYNKCFRNYFIQHLEVDSSSVFHLQNILIPMMGFRQENYGRILK